METTFADCGVVSVGVGVTSVATVELGAEVAASVGLGTGVAAAVGLGVEVGALVVGLAAAVGGLYRTNSLAGCQAVSR